MKLAVLVRPRSEHNPGADSREHRQHQQIRHRSGGASVEFLTVTQKRDALKHTEQRPGDAERQERPAIVSIVANNMTGGQSSFMAPHMRIQ